MDVSGIINNTIVSQLERLMGDYNENMRYYNQNMSNLLEMYRDGLREDRVRRQQRYTRFFSTPIYNNLFTTPINNRYLYTNTNTNTNTDLQDVIIRPTLEQIEDATESVIYDPSFSQVQCPISLEAFDVDEEICRIIHCGHLFKKTSLMSWFERNVRCPVCRYDIREYQDNYDNDEYHDEDHDEGEEQPTTRETLTNSVSNILRNFLTGELDRNIPFVNNSINDLILSFDIPLDFDISYNRNR